MSQPASQTDTPLALLRTQAWIDGQWVDADSGKTFDVLNPATGEVLASVPDMGAAETTRAIEAAQAAWADWRSLTGKARGAILRKWYDLILEHADDLALLMTLEQGKPLAEAKGEVIYGANFIEWFAEEAKRVYGDIIPATLPGQVLQVTKEPIGVVAAITPWNFPVAMITRKCAPALAVGCPVVVKPAQDTPLCALALADLAEKAGVPGGVMHIITASNPKDVGDVMTNHPAVRKISFTGSTAIGKLLTAQAAGTMKKVSMELGGNAPFIVFDDAHLDAAVEGALLCKFRNAGQTCVCANRLLVQDGIYDAFMEKFVPAVEALRVAPGTEEGAKVGPLINAKAVDKVQELVNDALGKGAKAAAGAQGHTAGPNFYQPTVLANADWSMRFAKEEIFGPVAPVFRFKTEEEAIQRANDTEFGLAAYFYSRDIGRIERVASGLEYGIVGINTGIISNEVAPFGGVKESGLGREGSKYGVEDFLEIKYRCVAGIDR